ncbi:MAG: hypothetical protein IKZ34_04120 [Alphaproteobacteria bacterium]|nr:hypothetical protein [Alphaproteobacteria bacterium]
MAKKSKTVEVIDMGGVKTVKKKQSVITWTKRIFAIVTVVWLFLVAWFPVHVKNTYSGPIKKSIVVSMFFDLQKGIVKQYEALLDSVANAVDLEKPIAVAIDKVKLAEKGVDKVTDTTASAKSKTAAVSEKTSGVKKLTGLANKFGVKTDGVDKAVADVDSGVAKANKTIASVDDTAAKVNQQLDKIKKDLTRVAQTEIDTMMDKAIKNALDKQSGGLGTTLLTNYGIEHVYPWRPSSWPVATKIYNELSASDVTTITVITNTVDKYFGYVAWGLVVAAWAIGLYIWLLVSKKVKAIIRPFNVCPRCGHTYADRRTALGLLKVFQPWNWF